MPLMLTDSTVRQHLEGEITIGLYAINPSTQCCKWVAIDADYKNAMEDLLKLQYHLIQDGVQPALEMSRRGAHLWIFLATPLLARDCRIYIHDLAHKLAVPVKGAAPAEGTCLWDERSKTADLSFAFWNMLGKYAGRAGIMSRAARPAQRPGMTEARTTSPS